MYAQSAASFTISVSSTTAQTKYVQCAECWGKEHSSNPQILTELHVIVYPSFLHLVKMRVRGKQRLPSTINGEYPTTTTFSPSQTPSLRSLSCRSQKEADGDPDPRGASDKIQNRDNLHTFVHPRGIYNTHCKFLQCACTIHYHR